VKTPTWDEFREFLKHENWEEDRATGHDFFEKTLPDGEILRTHASRSGSKTMSPGRSKAILSDQLRLSEAEFWEGSAGQDTGSAAESSALGLVFIELSDSLAGTGCSSKHDSSRGSERGRRRTCTREP